MANVKGVQLNIKTIEGELTKLRGKVLTAKDLYISKTQTLKEVCAAIDGLADGSLDFDSEQFASALQEISNGLSKRKSVLDARQADVDKYISKIETENKERDSLYKAQHKAENALKRCEKNVSDNLSELSSLKESLNACSDLQASISEALAKWQPSSNDAIRDIPIDMLRQQWTSFTTVIARWHEAIQTYRRTIDNKEKRIEAFVNEHEGVKRDMLEELAELTPSQINVISSKHRQTEADINQAKGAINSLQGQLATALMSKPEGLENVNQK